MRIIFHRIRRRYPATGSRICSDSVMLRLSGAHHKWPERQQGLDRMAPDEVYMATLPQELMGRKKGIATCL